MARSRSNARDAILKLRELREKLDREEARLREDVAVELGKVLLNCGAETIAPVQLRQLVVAAMALGIEQSLQRLVPQ